MGGICQFKGVDYVIMNNNISYETIQKPLIKNTLMKKRYINGVFKFYVIIPMDGYVLHDSLCDYPDENGELITCYTKQEVSCLADYDFTTNPRNFYTSLEILVNAEDIT